MRHSLSHGLLCGFQSDVAFPLSPVPATMLSSTTIAPKAQTSDHEFGLLASKT